MTKWRKLDRERALALLLDFYRRTQTYGARGMRNTQIVAGLDHFTEHNLALPNRGLFARLGDCADNGERHGPLT